MSKLNQIIAIEKGIKTRVNKAVSEIYKALQKPALFDGFSKNWEKLNEEGESRPSEKRRVQLKVDEILSDVGDNLTELFDVTAQKDFANCAAKADVVVGETTLLTQVPATYLLFLEKQLNDIKSAISVLPTLSLDEDWHLDEALGLYKTTAIQTRSTSKVQEPIVLFTATPEHPAQTQLITKDVIIGHWQTVRQSGATTESRKRGILKKIETLIKAVKFAREEANGVQAENQNIGDTVFQYLFG